MSSIETNGSGKKTNTLGINRIPEDTTLITVAKACEKFIADVKGIRIIKFKSDDTRNALIEFITTKQCESAKEMDEIKLSGESFPLHYARSRDSSSYNMIASEDKLYVKYPEGANEDDIIRMLGNVSISKPENAKNFFFATCKNIDEQCSLVKSLDNKPVKGGNLLVKVAIDKTRKARFPAKKIAN